MIQELLPTAQDRGCKAYCKKLQVNVYLLRKASVTKNCGVTCVTWKIHECANFVSNLLAYLSSVASQLPWVPEGFFS